MKLKQKYTYAMVIPTSMGVRITPVDRQPVDVSNLYMMQSTSAESNAGNIPASLGMRVKLLTKFVQDSPVSRFIKADLRRRNLEFEGRDLPQGGPWGHRHQFNIADSGYGMLAPNVLNDRAGEIGLTITSKDFDLERIFAKEGVAVVHMSGLFAGLSAQTGNFCLEISKIAREYGACVCFDLNYRASFWEGREKELRETFSQIAQNADILVGVDMLAGNEEYSLPAPPDAGGKGLSDKIEGSLERIRRVKSTYPNASIYASTLRQVLNANEHAWGAVMLSGDKWYVEPPRNIPILDRIGGGDGFVGGLLYGLLKGWEPEKCLSFGWATGAMASSVLTDYAQPSSEEQVWSVWEGNAHIKR